MCLSTFHFAIHLCDQPHPLKTDANRLRERGIWLWKPIGSSNKTLETKLRACSRRWSSWESTGKVWKEVFSLNVVSDFSSIQWWHRCVCFVSRSYLEMELKKERRNAAAPRQPSTPQRARRHPESAPKVNSDRVKIFTAVFFVFIRFILTAGAPRIPISQTGQWAVTVGSWGQNQSELQPVRSFSDHSRWKTFSSSLLFTHLSLHLRSLSHHEDEQVSRNQIYIYIFIF